MTLTRLNFSSAHPQAGLRGHTYRLLQERCLLCPDSEILEQTSSTSSLGTLTFYLQKTVGPSLVPNGQSACRLLAFARETIDNTRAGASDSLHFAATVHFCEPIRVSSSTGGRLASTLRIEGFIQMIGLNKTEKLKLTGYLGNRPQWKAHCERP